MKLFAGAGGAVGHFEQVAGSSSFLGYVVVADFDAAKGRVKAAGGALVGESKSVPTVGQMQSIVDGQGAALSLFTPESAEGAELATGQGSLLWLELSSRAMVLLEDQDRSRWDRVAIAEGSAILDDAMALGSSGPYQIQAAIAALHAAAPTSSETDWRQIAALYAGLLRFVPTPVVRLNHAVAVAMAWGTDAGLSLVEALGKEGSLNDYHLYWSTRGELMARRGDVGAARRAFQRAKNLAKQPHEKRFLAAKLAAL